LEIFFTCTTKLNTVLISYLKENQMEIIIGLIVIAGLVFAFTRKKQVEEVNAAPYKVEAPVEVAPVVEAVAEVAPVAAAPAPKAKATAKPRATKAKAPAKAKAAPKAAKPKAPAKPRARKPQAPK
jgi:FtsZ-interacting cell division protein ZipA